MPRPAKTSAICQACGQEFLKPRPEQVYCSRQCGFRARGERAKRAKQVNGKRCGRCKCVKPVTDFYKSKAQYDGLSSECKSCKKLSRTETITRARACHVRWDVYKNTARRARSRRITRKLCERSNATIEEWMHHLMQDGRDRMNASLLGKDERVEKENLRARMKYINNHDFREKIKEKSRISHQQRPWVMLARKHHRDARLAGVDDDGSVTVDVVKEMWLSTLECVYCGRELTEYNKSLEHMLPMSLGGEHSIRNVIVVCRLCNETKRARPFDEWICFLDEPWRSISHDILIQNYSGS